MFIYISLSGYVSSLKEIEKKNLRLCFKILVSKWKYYWVHWFKKVKCIKIYVAVSKYLFLRQKYQNLQFSNLEGRKGEYGANSIFKSLQTPNVSKFIIYDENFCFRLDFFK